MFAPFTLGCAVLLAILIRAMLPLIGERYMQIYHMRHSLPTVTSVTSVTSGLEASPEAVSQMLQWQKKAVTNCNNCNILFTRFSSLAPSRHIRALHQSPKCEDQPLNRSARGIDTTLSNASLLPHCNIATLQQSILSPLLKPVHNCCSLLQCNKLQQFSPSHARKQFTRGYIFLRFHFTPSIASRSAGRHMLQSIM